MSNPVKGTKLIYLFRVLGEAVEASALAFTKENKKTSSVDSDSTATKDGKIQTPGVAEIKISATALLADDDEIIGKLESAMLENKLVEVWEVNLAKSKGSNKFESTYYQGVINSLEKSSPAEDFTEISIEYSANGKGAHGDATVTEEQQEAASYIFDDTIAE